MKRRFAKPPSEYDKQDLDVLIAWVQRDDAHAISEAVAFTLAESRGIWHGRARAKICRNLKGRNIDPRLREALVQTICNRLVTGKFSQQFKDQLTMALRFRPAQMQQCAQEALESPKWYVRRYARWVLDKLAVAAQPVHVRC